MESPPVNVSVCICTFRRPSVAQAIYSVLAQEGVPASEFEILVCDDDPEESARPVVERIAAASAVAVRYEVSGSQNVARCRNFCLSSARGEWIAFIDDDEIADPAWLRQLRAAQEKYAADIVKGHVSADYPQGTPDWVLAGDPFTRDFGPTGSHPRIFGSGNLMFRRAIATSNALHFDPAFGKTGGEDIDFFLRYEALASPAVACREAVVVEMVSPARVTTAYLAKRARRGGHIFARVFVSRMSKIQRRLSMLRSALIVVACSPYSPVRSIFRKPGYWMFDKFWLHVGMIEWALGRRSGHME